MKQRIRPLLLALLLPAAAVAQQPAAQPDSTAVVLPAGMPESAAQPAAPETAAAAPSSEAPAPGSLRPPLDLAPLDAEPLAKQPRKQRFLPVRRRIDREIDKVKYVYKGEFMMGLTASYGTLSSEDSDFMVILDNINASGTIATIKPFFGYFYRNNHCIGVRFGYTYIDATLNTAQFDLGEGNDVSFDFPYISARSNNYSFALFHRTYAGLDPRGRFGLFAELELSVASGRSNFTYESGGELKSTFSENIQAKFSFNPGAAVYIFPSVCATLSFGLGGIQYTHVTQKDAEGNKVGSRTASKMRFRLNLAAINIGMNIHLWKKPKDAPKKDASN